MTPWPHATDISTDGSSASAGTWNLCTRCHELVLARDVAALADLMTFMGLGRAQRVELARRLR